MSIQDVLSKRLSTTKVSHTLPSFKPGQIVQGKIVKLFLNNKAQIQIGSHSMVAQLEASLTISENYHFQVKSNTDVTHLKVIGQQLQRNMNADTNALLKDLGLKTTRLNMALTQQLTKDKVPFDREQLVKAFHLLEGSSNKPQALSVIKNMIQSKLPLNEAVFQAISTKSTTGFTEQLSGLLQQMRQDPKPTPLKQMLVEKLSNFTNQTDLNKGLLIKHIMAEIEANQTNFLTSAKTIGLVDEKVDFSSWKNEWQNLVRKNVGDVPVQTVKTTNQSLTSFSLPFNLNNSEVLTFLGEIVENKEPIIRQTQTILQQFSAAIKKATIYQTPLADDDFLKLKIQIESKLLPLMPDKQQLHVETLLKNNPTSLAALESTLKTLSSKQNYEQIEQLVNNTKRGNELLLSKPNEQFLSQINRVLQSAGFAHEYNIANDLPEQQTATIKSMIIQLLQQSDGAINERAQQLLHFINGMQIQSVTETPNFLQASLLVPGEKLSLNKDLQLEFKGKKTESGKIDPDYCRILFYLDLTNLRETVIDMNVQKRAVSVTIFNDNTSILEGAQAVKAVLKEGLGKLDYHLSTVLVKPLKQMDPDKERAAVKTENNSYQGVDYRI
ncbi:hypothetical protein [Virgibacillus sp. DJP39]|uniref:hypothetical protein n=1 Tax=Virgibacillus sp. DJP39 TaxID=3409790 RepID=UPI003BB5399F